MKIFHRLILLAVVVFLWAAVVLLSTDHNSTDKNFLRNFADKLKRNAADEDRSGGDLQENQENKEARPFREKKQSTTAAPDNAASGGIYGFPEVLNVIYDELDRRIGESNLDVHLSLFDFESRGQVQINAREAIYPASMIKTLLLITTLAEAEQGNISLAEKHTLSENDKYIGKTRVGGSGILQFAATGSSYTVEELLSLMVGVSDNVAANIMFDRIGPSRMNDMVRRLNLKHSSFTRKMFDHQSPSPGNLSSAADLTAMLVALEDRDTVGEQLSTKGIRMMVNTADKERIGRYIAGKTVVANKVGTDSDLLGDMALIYFSERPPIALTIAVTEPPDQERAANFIGELAALIVSYLVGEK